jgi:signal transduction histidine kinase
VRAADDDAAAGKIFEVNASPMPGGGAVAVLHDITRIEQVERTQRDFVANVSHELRTPLTSITGYVETLLDHEKLSPVAEEFLTTILKNATRMNRLTEDLLTMARVESQEARAASGAGAGGFAGAGRGEGDARPGAGRGGGAGDRRDDGRGGVCGYGLDAAGAGEPD